jgi:hypothetical protein
MLLPFLLLFLSLASAEILHFNQIIPNVPTLPPASFYNYQQALVDITTQFEDIYLITFEALKNRVLEGLLEGYADGVEEEVRECREGAKINAVQKMMLIGAGCMSPDTNAPLAMMLQDVIQQLDYASSCSTLSVDLRSDLQNLIATGILQGLNFTVPWRGSLGMWRLATPPPMERDDLYYLYESGQLPLEVPEDTSEWRAVLKCLAANRTSDPVEVGKALDLHLDKSTALGVHYSKILHDALEFVYDGVETMCLFVKPIAEQIETPRSRIG